MSKIAGENEQIALFRYSLIVPALNGTYSQKSMNEYFIQVALKEHKLPNGKTRYFDVNSIKHWLYMFKKFGFDGLCSFSAT